MALGVPTRLSKRPRNRRREAHACALGPGDLWRSCCPRPGREPRFARRRAPGLDPLANATHAPALQEYGQLAKTRFVLGYLVDETERRAIGRQQNKGESLHALHAARPAISAQPGSQ
ncbi:MAG: transposase [Actinobacteria bacterium]|nr:transposase [Actinomycetota bacterium]